MLFSLVAELKLERVMPSVIVWALGTTYSFIDLFAAGPPLILVE